MKYPLRSEDFTTREAADAYRQERDFLYAEKNRYAAQYDAAIRRLADIYGLMHNGEFVVDGIRYSFKPPDDLVRAAWEGLSRAIKALNE